MRNQLSNKNTETRKTCLLPGNMEFRRKHKVTRSTRQRVLNFEMLIVERLILSRTNMRECIPGTETVKITHISLYFSSIKKVYELRHESIFPG